MIAPSLRFPEFNDRSWNLKVIGDFVVDHKGGAPLTPEDFVKDGSFEVIPKKAIASGGKLALDAVEPTFCSGEFFASNQRSVVDSKYLVTTLRDLVPSGPSIGYIVKFFSEKQYVLAQGVYGLKIDASLIEDFLIQYSNTSKYRVLMQTMMVGSTQVHIRNNDFFKTPIYVPLPIEQTKIADFLTAVDEKITQLTQKHDLLTQYKKGVMQKIFSQELRFKDDDGRDFSEWVPQSLANLGETFNGLTGKSADDFGHGASYITYKQIFDSPQIDITKFGQVKVAPSEKQNQVRFGDALFTTSSETPHEVGICSILLDKLDHDVYLNSFCFGFRTKSFEILAPNFARHLFRSEGFRQQVVLLAQGSTRFNISKTGFMKITVFVPSPNEQTKIANFLSAIDDKISNTQNQLEAMKQYKQGLLQQMFV